MMASGTTDPIRRGTTEGWDEILPVLTSSAAGEESYCESQVTISSDCDHFFKSAAAAGDKCKLGEGDTISINQALANCSQLDQLNNNFGGSGLVQDCGQFYLECKACETACFEQTIQDTQDEILPASVFVFVLAFYFVLVFMWCVRVCSLATAFVAFATHRTVDL